MDDLKSAIKNSKAYMCLECGKCTSVCPVAQFNKGYSPRVLVNRTLRYSAKDILTDKNIWDCLTCGLCDLRCPVDIAYMNLTLATRMAAQKLGEDAVCSHGGAAQSMMRIMTSTNLVQNRMDWIDNDLKVAEKGELLYFVGCLPHFDILFNDIGVHSISDAKSAVRILNYLGITPVVMPQERCCGHDLLWNGDLNSFKKLAEHNINEIKKSGAKKVVFSCPEGYRTFKIDYQKYFDFDFEVQHITELLNDAVNEGKLKFREMNKTVTFQDACRLGRHLGIYDAPRKVLTAIPGVKLVEMPWNRKQAICCGVSAWMNCSSYSKRIQMLRLKQAKQTGADLFVLSCPKCEIHFNCTMKEEAACDDIIIPTEQLVTFVADALVKGNGG
jgi:heterodisulfide reductase subunit D